MSTSTTKTSFLLGDWAALLGVVDGDFGPRKWPSMGVIAKFGKMNNFFEFDGNSANCRWGAAS